MFVQRLNGESLKARKPEGLLPRETKTSTFHTRGGKTEKIKQGEHKRKVRSGGMLGSGSEDRPGRMWCLLRLHEPRFSEAPFRRSRPKAAVQRFHKQIPQTVLSHTIKAALWHNHKQRETCRRTWFSASISFYGAQIEERILLRHQIFN